MSEERYCYVGRMEGCRCIGVVVVDDPEYADETAKSVAEMIREGLQVERITVPAFKKDPSFGCKHELKMKECRKRGLNRSATPVGTDDAK